MDPFSVATGSAGLISLGLTVSGGLIQYCKDYQSRDADLAQLSQHAQELKTFLTLIENRTTGPQSPNGDIYTPLKECQDASEACLQDVRRLNDKYTTRRNRNIIQSLAYPFDRRKLQDKRTQLSEFNMRLLGYLQLVNLDLTRSIRTQMSSESAQVATAVTAVERQVQTSITNAERTISSTRREDINRLEVSFQQGLQKTETNVTASVTADLRLLSNNFGKGQEQQTSIIMHRLDQVVQMLQSHNVAKTAEITADNQLVVDTSNMNSIRRVENVARGPSLEATVRSNLCGCLSSRHRNSNIQHRKACPYSFSNRERRTFTFQLNAFCRRIIVTWKIDYSALAWAYDFRIQPNLTFRATVQKNAPAFRAIPQAGWAAKRRSTLQDIEETFQNYLLELPQLFTSGQGSPKDVDISGNNLIHLVIQCYTDFLFALDVELDEKAASLLVQLIAALVHMGVPINDISDDRVTPLDSYLRSPRWVDSAIIGTYVANSLIDMGATTVGSEIRAPSVLRSILTLGIAELYEPLACTDLFHEILLRSRPGVIRLLNNSLSSLQDRTQNGQTPLHLAVNWPEGLSIIIESAGESIRDILSLEDNFGFSAFQYAVFLCNPDPIRLLIDAGAQFQRDIFSSCPFRTSTSQGKACVDVIVAHLALQRRKLLDLAFRNLPPEAIDKFGLEENLLDYDAFAVAKALKQHQVPMDTVQNTFWPGSLYHLRGIDPYITQKFFDAGFQQTNAKLNGYTPLMNPTHLWRDAGDMLKLVFWFEDHGLDLHEPIPIPKNHAFTFNAERTLPIYALINFISHILGQKTIARNSRGMVRTEYVHRVSKLLRDPFTDPCICYCTTNGCTSASKYVRGFSQDRFAVSLEKRINKGIGLAEKAMADCKSHTVALSLIRVMTFNMLGMRHTCCDFRRNWMSELTLGHDLLHLMESAEVNEIREEDHYLAKLLDALMKEFEAKFLNLTTSMPLRKFMKKYWWPRMNEVEKGRDELSASDLHAIREIGVVLDEH